MAGNQKLHALAQDEFIAHASAIAVARIHQCLQQIVAGRFVAALADVFKQNGVRAGAHVFVFAQFARNCKIGIQVGLKGLPNDKSLDGADGMADEVDVFVLQPRAEQRSGDHREGHFHQVGVDIDRADLGLPVEVPQRVGERVLHDRRKNLKLFSLEPPLDKTTLRAPGLSVGGQKTFAQEVPHPLYLNFGLLVILRIGLQHVLNDGGISSGDGLFNAAQLEPECVAKEFVVLGQHVYGIDGHRTRIREGSKSGDNWYSFGQGHTWLPRCLGSTVGTFLRCDWSAQDQFSFPSCFKSIR